MCIIAVTMIKVDKLFEFACSVPEPGYRWITGEMSELSPRRAPPGMDRFLVINAGPREGGYVRRYNPLVAEPALFLRFGELEPTEEAILSFANQFGWLRGTDQARLGTRASSQRIGVSGDGLDLWRLHIHWMREVQDLWKLIRSRNTAELGRRIQWDSDLVRYRSESRHLNLADRHSRSASVFLDLWRQNEIVRPARRALQILINEQISACVQGRLIWGDDRQELEFHVVPDSLLGALWLQMARAVANVKQYRDCPICGRTIEISRDKVEGERTGKREDVQFCSNACRSKNLRTRQAEARRLARRGRSVAQIAEKLGTQTATVRKWIE